MHRLKVIALAPIEIVGVSLYGLAIGFRDSLRNIREAWLDAVARDGGEK